MAQTGAGNAATTSTVRNTDKQDVNHVLLITLFVIICAVILVILYREYKKCQSRWIDKRIEEYTFRRLRMRLSKRFTKQGDAETEETPV